MTEAKIKGGYPDAYRFLDLGNQSKPSPPTLGVSYSGVEKRICIRCHKIWTLDTQSGDCQWCGKPSTCHSTTVKSRLISARSKPSKPQIEANYEGLEGDWLDWLEVAKRYEVKVPYQDREDLRHTIILELALARTKTTEPIPLYRAYRIASYMVAEHWRAQRKLSTGLDCRHCSKAHRKECKERDLYSVCPKLIRLEYLESETVDAEGNTHTIEDTLADDNAIDLEAWQDAGTWLLGFPTRLLEIAHKREEGIPLNDTDQRYFTRQRVKELKRYQKALF